MSLASTRAAGQQALKKKSKRVWPLRVAVQVAFLALMPFMGELSAVGMAVFSGILITGTVIFGRFGCGWLCPLGSILDGWRWVVEKTVLKWLPRLDFAVPRHLHRALLILKYVLLAVVVALSFSFEWRRPENASAGSLGTIGVVIIVVLVALTGLVPRAFCRYVCPAGAALAVVSLPRRLRVSKPHADCGKKCMICTVNCPMGIDLANTDAVRSPECIQCLRCSDGCPRNTAQLQLIRPRMPRPTPPPDDECQTSHSGTTCELKPSCRLARTTAKT